MGGENRNKITAEMRTKAFALYAEGGHTIQKIADAVGVQRNTILKLKEKEGWDTRLKKTHADALDHVMLTMGESIRQSLTVVQVFKEKLLLRARSMAADAIPASMIQHLPDLHQFEMELLGQVHAAQGDGGLNLYSEEQLDRMLRQGDQPIQEELPPAEVDPCPNSES